MSFPCCPAVLLLLCAALSCFACWPCYPLSLNQTNSPTHSLDFSTQIAPTILRVFRPRSFFRSILCLALWSILIVSASRCVCIQRRFSSPCTRHCRPRASCRCIPCVYTATCYTPLASAPVPRPYPLPFSFASARPSRSPPSFLCSFLRIHPNSPPPPTVPTDRPA
ncbi:hypothetical protein FA95DRAFT_955872 [Auriscalpium vulgare]|uniref:Uncharacterized protein n=1 Tax=Auriscalpium vulgare TaxID=40419 RepID=A0ACB8R775_9AGAM|nr:hypothetical protein FA95DRAFT_955872 [Auriscalpium vulgare]